MLSAASEEINKVLLSSDRIFELAELNAALKLSEAEMITIDAFELYNKDKAAMAAMVNVKIRADRSISVGAVYCFTTLLLGWPFTFLLNR